MLWIVRWLSPNDGLGCSRIIWAANDTAAFLAAVEENPSIDDCLDTVRVDPYQRFGLWQFEEQTYSDDEQEGE